MDNRDAMSRKLVRPSAVRPNVGSSSSTSGEASRNGSLSSTATSITGDIVKKLTPSAAISPLNSGRPGRLASFRPERDLTLGASKPGVGSLLPSEGAAKPKKVFAPTIPARRAKAQENPAIKDEKPKDFTNSRGRGRGRDSGPSRGRGRGRPELIQTGGSLFGDGVSDLGLKNRSSSSYTDKDSSSANMLEKPKLNSQNLKINKEEEDAALSALLRDDFIDDYEIGDGYDPDLVRHPIQLPKMSSSSSMKEEPDVEVKAEGLKVITPEGEVTIKQEKEDAKPATETKTAVYQRRLIPSQITSEDIFQNEGDIIFFQLPDVMPCLKAEKERPHIKVEPGTASKPSEPLVENGENTKKNVFDDVPEGRLGTLRIHKSGKLSLQMGDHSFVLDSATQVSFLQDLISIEVNSEEKSGKMKALGPIKYKAVCLPNWDELIDDSEFSC